MWIGFYTIINLFHFTCNLHCPTAPIIKLMNLLWYKIHDPLEPLLAHSSHILCRNPIVNVVVIPKQVLDKGKVNLFLIAFID